MNVIDFEELIKEIDDNYFVINDESMFLVYKNDGVRPVFIGSVYEDDVDDYDVEDTFRFLGIM